LKKNKLDFDKHKLIYHPKEVTKFLNGEIFAPIYVEMGPINSCNHHCIFCALDYLNLPKTLIKKEIMISTLKNMANFGVKAVMFAGEGEPLLHPEISDIINSAKAFGLDVAVTTNGILMSPSLADKSLKNLTWIKFSVDAGTKKTYAKIHGTKEQDFEILLNNIKYCIELRNKQDFETTIGTQILIIDESIAEVETLIQLFSEINPDYLVLKPYSQHPDSINKQTFDWEKYDCLLKELATKYSKPGFQVIYRELAFNRVEGKVDFNVCRGVHFFTLIDAYGNVIPCNIFYQKPDFYYGNLNENTFEEIWKSKKRQDVLKKLKEMGCKNCRKGCRLTFINKYLDELLEKKVKHVNFI